MFTSKPCHHYTTKSIENGVDGRTNILPQVETANIPVFQLLGIISLERALPDDLKTYIY